MPEDGKKIISFFVTFGVQYSQVQHPVDFVHPDGYVEVQVEQLGNQYANAYEKARDRVTMLFGNQWAFMYTEGEFARTKDWYHPRGRLALMAADGTLTVEQRVRLTLHQTDREPSAPGPEASPEGSATD